MSLTETRYSGFDRELLVVFLAISTLSNPGTCWIFNVNSETTGRAWRGEWRPRQVLWGACDRWGHENVYHIDCLPAQRLQLWPKCSRQIHKFDLYSPPHLQLWWWKLFRYPMQHIHWTTTPPLVRLSYRCTVIDSVHGFSHPGTRAIHAEAYYYQLHLAWNPLWRSPLDMFLYPVRVVEFNDTLMFHSFPSQIPKLILMYVIHVNIVGPYYHLEDTFAYSHDCADQFLSRLQS